MGLREKEEEEVVEEYLECQTRDEIPVEVGPDCQTGRRRGGGRGGREREKREGERGR